MGFQSYEMLAGEKEHRDAQQKAFLASEIRNPKLDYPKLDERALDIGIRNLENYLDETRKMEDTVAGDAAWDSASYRMAEMYWLKEVARLNRLADSKPYSDDYLKSALRFQEANEQLYGAPEEDITEAVYGEVIAQAKEKQLHSSAQKIYDELVNGVVVDVDGEQVEIPGIGESYDKRLPQNISEKLGDLREFLKEEFSDIFDIVNEYWENEASKNEEGERRFTTQDMKNVFERAHAHYDPEDQSGIRVEIHPESSQLAWDTSSMSVRIGESRGAITSPTDMAAKIIHEYGIHGLRALHGQKTDLPMLSTGMFTNAQPGERSDYLTFEEGFASMCEIAVDDSFTKWKPLHVSRYLIAASSYEGADFRQSFERNWRARLLMSIGENKEVDQKLITKEKKQAYLSAVRLLRGSQTHLPNKFPVTYNKDLAYLYGKLDVLSYIEQRGKDENAYSRLLTGKFDPNNSIQDEIAYRYAG